MSSRRYSRSPSPRREYSRRRRSPSPRGRYGRRAKDLPTSLLVRNLPHDCRPEDLRGPFGEFGPLKDIYLPRDYYTGEPRGFGFVQYVDPDDATEAKYEMDGQILLGRELTVLFAEETRKKPTEMKARERVRRTSSSRYSPSPCRGHSYSPSPPPRYSRAYSRSPRRTSYSRYSRSPPRRHSYSPSPPPRYSRAYSRSPRRPSSSRYSRSPRRGHSYSPSPPPRYSRAYSRSPSYYSPSPRRRRYSRSISPERQRGYRRDGSSPRSPSWPSWK